MSIDAKQPGQAGRRLSALRILAAEDVDINRMILEDLLLLEGAQVGFAEDFILEQVAQTNLHGQRVF